MSSSAPLKVAIICDDLMLGGWTTLTGVVALLSREKIESLVICLFGKGPNADFLESRGVRVVSLGMSRSNFLCRFPALVRILRKEKIELVHTQLHLSHLIGQSAALLAGVRHRMMHLHTIEENPGGFQGFWKRQIVKRTNSVIAVSRAMSESFLASYPFYHGGMRVIYNGVNIPEIRRRNASGKYSRAEFNIPQNAFTFITVANLKWQKGHRYLVEAAALLNNDKTRFLVVGGGPEEEAIRKKIAANHLEQQFIFLGKRADIPELLALADAFVLPSVLEGLGICLLEAFAAGLPCISTRVGGIPEIALDDENSLLVPPADPRALADAMRRMADDRQLHARLAGGASRHIEDYNVQKIARQYEEAYLAESQRGN